MFELLTVLSILGYALLLNRFAGWRESDAFFFVSTAIICVLYLFALMGLLKQAALLIMVFGCCLSIMFLFIKVKDASLRSLLTPGVMFFLLSALALWILTRSDYFGFLLHWDDFSNWARTSKVIFLNDGLVQLNDPVWQKDYPPGAELFHYYVFQVSGYAVSSAFFAQGLLLLAACAPLLGGMSKRRGGVVTLFVTFFYFLFHSFGLGFHTLTVDLLVAVFFGCGVSAYWISDRSVSAVIRVMPVIMALPLIKVIGVVFAAVITVVIISDQLWRLKKSQSTPYSVGTAFFLLPLLFLSFMSWQHHFEEMGASKTFKADISLEKVMNSFSSEFATEHQKLIKHNFAERLMASKAFIVILVLFLVAYIFIRGRQKNSSEKRAVDLLFLWLFLGLVAYSLLLLVLYMFFFGAYEASYLASFNRYMITYLVGFSIVVFTLLFYQYFEDDCYKFKRNSLYLLLVFSFIAAGAGYRGGLKTLEFSIFGGGIPAVNVAVENLAQQVSSVLPRGAKIYFIWQNSTGLEMQMFSYGTIPRLGNRGCWSVGEKYYPGDVWTCVIGLEKFRQVLREYDYLFVGRADAAFWARYKNLFENGSMMGGRLYKILKTNRELKLSYVLL